MQYFKYFNKISYDLLGDGNYKTITNVFRRAKVNNQLLDEVTFYTYYDINNGERPDIVSYKLYGSINYHWTFSLLNPQLQNINEDWPFSSQELEHYVEEKYVGTILRVNTLNLATSFEIGEIVRGLISGASGKIISKDVNLKQILIERTGSGSTIDFQDNELIRGDTSEDYLNMHSQREFRNAIHHYEDADGNIVDRFYPGAYEITNSEYEYSLNDRKTQIKVIRPEYVEYVTDKFKKVMA